MVATALASLWIDVRQAWAPRRDPIPAITWASLLTLPGGTRKGQTYNPRTHAGQYEFLIAYTSNEWQEFVVLGPTQDGKTVSAVLVPILHRLIECGEAVVYGLPDELAGQRQWREKVLPVLHLSGLADQLPKHGIGSREGSRVTVMTVGTGLLTWMGAGGKNESAQSSVTAPLVVEDEVDSMKPGMPEKIARRADAYGIHARRIYTSTIKHDDGSSKILLMYAQSTGARLWFACPSCGRFQTLEWERVTYDETDDLAAFESARMRCEHCAVLWTDDDRKSALRNHRLVMRDQRIDEANNIVGERPRTLMWGIRWTALDSPLRTLGQLAVWHRRAKESALKGDHDQLRQFHRDQLCSIYVDDRTDEEGKPPARISRSYLEDRSKLSTYGPCVHAKDNGKHSFHVSDIPDGVKWFVATIDVQDNRVYHVLTGRDDEMRSWDVAWGFVMACGEGAATESELHMALDHTKSHLHKVVDVAAKPWGMRGVDVGHREAEIRNWLARSTEWFAVRGVGEAKSDEMYRLGERENDGKNDLAEVVHVRRAPNTGWRTYWIVSNNVRHFAQGAFLVPIGAAGAAHLPRGLPAHDHYIRHLCSHAWIVNKNTSRWEWSKKSEHGGQVRDDWLACRTYGEALARWHMTRVVTPRPRRTYGVVATL